MHYAHLCLYKDDFNVVLARHQYSTNWTAQLVVHTSRSTKTNQDVCREALKLLLKDLTETCDLKGNRLLFVMVVATWMRD